MVILISLSRSTHGIYLGVQTDDTIHSTINMNNMYLVFSKLDVVRKEGRKEGREGGRKGREEERKEGSSTSPKVKSDFFFDKNRALHTYNINLLFSSKFNSYPQGHSTSN